MDNGYDFLDKYYGGQYEEYNAVTGGHMSNKFLPFITEKSGLGTIFKALVQRSKGLSSRDLGIMYTAVVKFGIDKVKAFIATLPEDLPANEIFKNVINQYRPYEISVHEMNYWCCVLLNYGLKNIANKENYKMSELSVMFAVIAAIKPNKLVEINFEWNTDVLIELAAENYDCTVREMPHIKFAAKGKRIGFISSTEFKAFIASWLAEGNEGILEIMPVFIDKSALQVKSHHYSDKNCDGPYEVMPGEHSTEVPYPPTKPAETWSAEKWVDSLDDDEEPF